MKTASKVTLIISIVLSVLSIVFTCVFCFVWLPVIINSISTENPDAGVLLAILNLVNTISLGSVIVSSAITITFSSISLVKIEKVKNKDELMVWGILCAIFCYLVPGILMLCIKDEDLQKDVVKPDVINNQ